MTNSTPSSTALAVRPATPATTRAVVDRAGREMAYLLTDLPVGIVSFTVFVTLLATGASLAITLAGVPLLAATLVLGRNAAGWERSRAHALLGESIEAPPARAPGGTSILSRLAAPLRDEAAWRASGYFVLMLPVGTATFSAAVSWVGGSLYLLTLPLWAWTQPHNGPHVGDGAYWSSPLELAASSAAGLLLLALAPYVIHAITHLDRAALRLLAAR